MINIYDDHQTEKIINYDIYIYIHIHTMINDHYKKNHPNGKMAMRSLSPWKKSNAYP